MISSFLLHIQPAKVNRHALKFRTTLGLGLISLYLFLILIGTGVLLMFYYVPSTDTRYQNMKDLEFVVSAGLVLRNMHRWAAHLMVLFVMLHMCRVFYTGAYKRPREFNWVIGVGLFLLTLACPSPVICCLGTSSRSGPSPSAPASPATRRSSGRNSNICCSAATWSGRRR